MNSTQLIRIQVQIIELSVGIAGKGGMGRITEIRPQRDVVDAFGNRAFRRVSGHGVTGTVPILNFGHLAGAQGLQLVRSFEVAVLQQWLIDLGDDFVFIGAIGPRRIKMLGSLLE